MGVYSYQCQECNGLFDVRHPYKHKLENCILCGAESPSKVLSSPIKVVKNRKTTTSHKTGEIVTNSIEEAKDEIKKEKKKYRERLENDS